MRALGMMSGTSLDGIDLAVLETDGETIAAFGPVASFHYDGHQAERALIFGAMEDAAGLTDRAARPGRLVDAEAAVTRLNTEAILAFLKTAGSVDVIGFHGQTVVHRPEIGLTVQLGDGWALARAAGVPVVFDFRAADMAIGGQGAPFVPVFHRALVKALDVPGPVAVLNLGGVANVTYLDGDAEPVGCDVGPANALLDDFMLTRTGQPFDADSAAANAGKADETAIAGLLKHGFFDQPPPKSLDRNAFRRWVSERLPLDRMSVEDGAATLTAFTAAATMRILPHLPRRPMTWIVVGGGARNPAMMRMLAERLAPAGVLTGGEVGWSSDHVEAQAFAFLAVRSLRGLPLSFPWTTGVPQPTTGGVICLP
ncbi:anhydro-N-acetylmuramic acid kinase [Flaviflagellibacter deserti]|uniref:Anhydro-N-acetylmuramic acid kinase n=1 Tax=Flaviflagellibacter deserti TaxID=2267266 RepID=A0ABV9Z4D7_9HYPH